jgi:pyruvate,water dikinase
MHSIVILERGRNVANISPRLLGGKAYQLALAAADALPVPKSLVLTTELFPSRALLEALSTKPPSHQTEFVRRFLLERGIDLSSAIRTLQTPTFACRSSATAEDLAVASFAGSFTTRLQVPEERIHAAIFDVWASTFSNRVHDYMRNRSLEHLWDQLKMAVLIQPMVSPLLSGVGLSHPLGRPTHPYLLITAVRGLGEPLVRGDVEPQTCSIERGSWAIVEQQNVLDSDVVYEMAGEIGRTIEFLEIKRNAPQDIEFVIDHHLSFILLQNRPIVDLDRDHPSARSNPSQPQH